MADYDKFLDKKVVITENLSEANEKGELAEEFEGTVQAVAGDTLMVKPKGKTTPRLVEVSNIESIDFAPEKAKNLTRKKLKPVGFGQARNHLLERHGFTLAQVNDMTEKQAFEHHEKVDHVAADLGHVHVAPQEGDKSDEASESDD